MFLLKKNDPSIVFFIYNTNKKKHLWPFLIIKIIDIFILQAITQTCTSQLPTRITLTIPSITTDGKTSNSISGTTSTSKKYIPFNLYYIFI